MRHFSVLDHVLCNIDTALRAIYVPEKRLCRRQNPGDVHQESTMSLNERRQVAGLMRVNHAGEVCAQALYQGQAATANHTTIKAQMLEAATEEIDHLAWCEQRLRELNSHTSLLNPLWYAGSFMLGALAGLVGDGWSLGFVAETEKQVTAHLEKHLQKIPSQDLKTKAILTQMRDDEALHAKTAIEAGAIPLPFVIKQIMQGVAKWLTRSSYHL